MFQYLKGCYSHPKKGETPRYQKGSGTCHDSNPCSGCLHGKPCSGGPCAIGKAYWLSCQIPEWWHPLWLPCCCPWAAARGCLHGGNELIRDHCTVMLDMLYISPPHNARMFFFYSQRLKVEWQPPKRYYVKVPVSQNTILFAHRVIVDVIS